MNTIAWPRCPARAQSSRKCVSMTHRNLVLRRRTVSTASLEGARDHARAQAAAATPATTRTIPAASATGLPASVDPGTIVWDETISAGNYASHDLPAGAVLRI